VSLPSRPPEPPKTHFLRRHAVKLVASGLIGVGLVTTLQKSGLKIVPQGVSFADIKWWTLPVYVLTLAAMNYFRATRWRFLLRAVVDVPIRRLIVVSWVGFAAIFVMPFRIGEFVRPYMLAAGGPAKGKDGKPMRISVSMATGSVIAERVADGLYLSLVLAVALLAVPTVDPLPKTVVGLNVSVQQVRMYGFTMLGIFTFAFTVLAVFYFARVWAHKTTLAVFGLVSRPLGEKLAGIAEKVADGLHFIGSGRDAAPFLLETTLYWGFNALGMWLLAWGCGIVHASGTAITFGESCALMGMLGVTVLIPGAPGALGLFQAGIYAGMTMFFPTSVVVTAGAAYVFLLYVLQTVWTLATGAAFMLFDRGSRRALQEAESREENPPERPTEA
jgi:glycosyltransferase 2 family protein